MENIQENQVYAFITIGIFAMLAIAIAMVIFYFRSQQKFLMQEIRAEQSLLEQIIMTQEQERSRIAKDLHDDVGSKLNLAYIHLQQLKKRANDVVPNDEDFSNITYIINEAINTIRNISHNLIPPILEEFGLFAALKELASSYNKTGLVQVDLQITTPQNIQINSLISLNLFRILQELISNSIKHGEANSIRIHLINMDQQVQCFYRDNGKGFDAKRSSHKKGLGLKNIESRLRIIEAQWSYSSSAMQGLDAQITFNIKPD